MYIIKSNENNEYHKTFDSFNDVFTYLNSLKDDIKFIWTNEEGEEFTMSRLIIYKLDFDTKKIEYVGIFELK